MVVAEIQQEKTEENSLESLRNDISAEPLFTFEILKIIRDAQQQHGLRHGDYQRYRGYCTRRIRRLRKVLHLAQGDRRHFKRKDVTHAHLTDERYLYIPLMQAERAWSYGMQLRQEANTEPRKRFHLSSRLRKATVYADLLNNLCESEKCDARTKLEAQAYVAWMHGSLFFELKKWQPAMENLEKALVVYQKLCGALSEEDQIVYRQKCDELDPSLRFCAYSIKDAGGSTSTNLEELLSLRSSAHGDLLDTLMSQTREQRSEVLSEAEWRGRAFAVRPEQVRGFLLAERALDKRGAADRPTIEQLERHLMDCKDAIAALRDEMKADNQSVKTKQTGAGVSSLQYLLSYLTYIRLNRTVERNLLMVESARSALNENVESEGSRRTRPQDVVRLYEIILINLGEMQQLPGLEDDTAFHAEVEAKATVYKAFRCYYIAEVLSGLKRWREAGALLRRAESYAQSAAAAKSTAKSDCTELAKLQDSIDSARYTALANAALQDQLPQQQQQQPSSRSNKVNKVPLLDRLEEYCEDRSLVSGSAPNVVRLPPDMKPIPCKPLFFDLALNLVEFPSLEDKLDGTGKKGQSAGITSFVKGFLSWGGNK